MHVVCTRVKRRHKTSFFYLGLAVRPYFEPNAAVWHFLCLDGISLEELLNLWVLELTTDKVFEVRHRVLEVGDALLAGAFTEFSLLVAERNDRATDC